MLQPTRLFALGDAERRCLHQVALHRIEQLNLSCPPVVVPDGMPPPPAVAAAAAKVRRPMKLKRKALTTSIFDTVKSSSKGSAAAAATAAAELEQKEAGGGGQVFGIPLQKVVENDRKLMLELSGKRNVSVWMIGRGVLCAPFLWADD